LLHSLSETDVERALNQGRPTPTIQHSR